jgi:hypothetical protein
LLEKVLIQLTRGTDEAGSFFPANAFFNICAEVFRGYDKVVIKQGRVVSMLKVRDVSETMRKPIHKSCSTLARN